MKEYGDKLIQRVVTFERVKIDDGDGNEYYMWAMRGTNFLVTNEFLENTTKKVEVER